MIVGGILGLESLDSAITLRPSFEWAKITKGAVLLQVRVSRISYLVSRISYLVSRI